MSFPLPKWSKTSNKNFSNLNLLIFFFWNFIMNWGVELNWSQSWEILDSPWAELSRAIAQLSSYGWAEVQLSSAQLKNFIVDLAQLSSLGWAEVQLSSAHLGEPKSSSARLSSAHHIMSRKAHLGSAQLSSRWAKSQEWKKEDIPIMLKRDKHWTFHAISKMIYWI